jgi:NAD(P)H-hydrate repair Nnr-like enzyme with NAD(P)H-hydrate epimerase domain
MMVSSTSILKSLCVIVGDGGGGDGGDGGVADSFGSFVKSTVIILLSKTT